MGSRKNRQVEIEVETLGLGSGRDCGTDAVLDSVVASVGRILRWISWRILGGILVNSVANYGIDSVTHSGRISFKNSICSCVCVSLCFSI